MRDKLLIIGIDPGLTVGYAFLDTEGNVVEVGSAKQFSLSDLISLVINHGQPVAVGCDKKVIPSFVQRFAAKFNARILFPKEDMLVEEKKQLTSADSYSNNHEMDALASAIFAYKHLAPQINRVERFVEKYNREHYRTALLKKVIRNEYMSVHSAMQVLEEKKSPEVVERVVPKREFKESDYLELMERFKRQQLENQMMREQNNKIEEEILQLRSGGMIKIIKKVDGQGKINEQKSNVNVLRHELGENRAEISYLKKNIEVLNRLLSNAGNAIILKKLRNLSYEEIMLKKNILNIKERDILLVSDANAISERAIAQLKAFVNIIITRKPVSGKLKNDLGFIFINADGLDLLETEHFAVISKRDFDRKLKEVNLIREVIDSYRKERVINNG